MRKGTVTKEVLFDDEDGNAYAADVTWEWWVENYGEDADGNRGVMTQFDEISKIKNFTKNGKSIKEENVPQDIMTKFDEAELQKI